MRFYLALSFALSLAVPAASADLQSGPQPGDRTLPFTSNVVTGPHRGQQHCYVCDLKDEPAVLVFARNMSEPTARLLRGVRDAVQERQKEKLFAWVVFLSPQGGPVELDTERKAFDFARANGATNLPVAALGDPDGPPGYRIATDAEVTVLFLRRGKVLANRAFRAKEWSGKAADGVLRDLARVFTAGS